MKPQLVDRNLSKKTSQEYRDETISGDAISED
jgi:hypothetical protein